MKDNGSLDTIRAWIRQSRTAGVHERRKATGGRKCANDSAGESPEPIAITGIHGYFPGCDDMEDWWDSLDGDRSLITEIPKSRFDWERYYRADGDAEGHIRTKWGGYIPDIASFDARLFGVSSLEAGQMDPRQRLLLMSAWRTLEDAGYDPETLQRTSTGVFIGCEGDEYAQLVRASGVVPVGLFNGSNSMHANRISYAFGLNGPSEVIDTMCSSFAVGLHRAVVFLRAGVVDKAIVGAANVILRPEPFIALSHSGLVSTRNTVRSFGKGADGYLRSEGVGTVLLERIDDAVVDRRRIHATVRHVAVNHNGKGGMSIWAPNVEAHKALIKRCYREACIDPRHLRYIEAQGMGLPVADIAEWTALNRALVELSEERSLAIRPGSCVVSTIKPMVGHMEAASALGALSKIIRSFKTRKIHRIGAFDEPNEFCDGRSGPCRFATETEDWPDEGFPRLGALHSFGSGGNNVHVLLQEWADSTPHERQSVAPRPFDLARYWLDNGQDGRASNTGPDEADVLQTWTVARGEGSANEESDGSDGSTLGVEERALILVEHLIRPHLDASLRAEDRDRGFVDLGLKSIAVVSLWERLSALLDPAFPVEKFFEHTSVSGLAKYLSCSYPDELQSLVYTKVWALPEGRHLEDEHRERTKYLELFDEYESGTLDLDALMDLLD